jgi:hypothetical protein
MRPGWYDDHPHAWIEDWADMWRVIACYVVADARGRDA